MSALKNLIVEVHRRSVRQVPSACVVDSWHALQGVS